MRHFYLFVLQFVSLLLTAQAYTISVQTSTYDTLTEYQSLIQELIDDQEDPFSWVREFDLDFTFPYFDETYTTILLESDGTGYFPNTDEFNMFLFAGPAYVVNPPSALTGFLPSDVRYQTLETERGAALVVEFHEVLTEDEFFENGANHVLNFQYRFFEDGTIEVHFGDIDLDQNSYYFPGQGFSFDNEDPDDNIYGPFLSITDDDIVEGACIGGDFASPEILYDQDDNCNVLTSIPPAGSVVRFLPEGAVSRVATPAATASFAVVQDGTLLRVAHPTRRIQHLELFDLAGRACTGANRAALRTDGLTTGIYVLRILADGEAFTQRIFVNP